METGKPVFRVGALLALVIGGLVGCTGGDDAASDSATTTESTADVAVTTEPAAPLDPARTYGVGRREMSFVDDSRPTDAVPMRGLPEQPDRTLETIVEFPTEVDGAEDPAEGAFPLVVFSHGNGGNASMYAPFLEPLVREGYIVALPSFPVTSVPGAPLDDARNQPEDVSFVIDELLDLSADPDGWLAGHVDGERIAAAGHSLGAVTTVGLVYDECCVDDRVKASVLLAGTGVASGPGTLDDRPPTPMLLIHGVADNIVPVSGSDSLFDAATGPTYYLRYDNADHFGIAIGDNGPLTTQAVVAFLDAELMGWRDALAALPDAVATTGAVQLKTSNTDN